MLKAEVVFLAKDMWHLLSIYTIDVGVW
jgi:hypothetical protein